MAAEKKVKKDKEIVLELENQIRDIRQLLADQQRCLDQHLDSRMGMLQDLQEYYRRHAEVELEFSKTLDKLAKQLSVRQKRDPFVSGYSTHAMWQTLMDSTRQQSKNHGFLSEIFNPLALRLVDIVDDIVRIHKRCREMVTNHQEELFKVLTELDNAMKTYHQYHGNSQLAETKLRRVQSQRVRVDQQNALSKRFINYDKKEEQKQAKYTENKLKSLKARNEYLLSIETANAALQKYFGDDFPKLVQQMDFGYHSALTQVANIHSGASHCVINNDQERLNLFINQSQSIVASHDNACFCSQHQRLFVKPEVFEFQPHKGDEIFQISAQKAVQDDMITRKAGMKERMDSNSKDNQERLRNMEALKQELLSRIAQTDVDVVQLYKEEKTGLKPPIDKEKRRDERLKMEDAYLQMFHEYMKADGLIVRLNSKFLALHKALGEGIHDDVIPPGFSTEPVRKRPPSLPPKPKKMVKKANGSHPRLFGGTIEEYVEMTGTQIPIVVRSCIRIINLYGMHHQGIFRVPGSQNDINNYKQQFEKGIDPFTSKVEGDDINNVAGLLKLYFRELKEPLFPAEMFNRLISTAERFSGNEQECRTELRDIIASLPQPRMIVMHYLFSFLNHLTDFSDENMMDPYNLSVCFGPTLLPTPVSSDLYNHVFVNKLIEIIITLHEDLFPNDGYIIYERFIVESEKDFIDGMSDDDLLNSNIPDEDDDIEDHEAIAEYDYQGRTDNELSFQKGDVLMLFGRISRDWWNGEFMGQRGLVPDKYIQLMKKRDQPTNLKKDSIQAKSSENLLSPDDASISLSSSLGRCVSQPNVAVPVPLLPQLGIPTTDPPPNVAHSLPVSEDRNSADPVLMSIDSALATVQSSLCHFANFDRDQAADPTMSQRGLLASESDLDIFIPVPGRPRSPFAAESVNDGASQAKSVRKSTSLRGPNEAPAAKDHLKSRHPTSETSSRNFSAAESLAEILAGSTPSLASKLTPVDPHVSDKRKSKSSTLPPNLPPPHFGKHSLADMESDLPEESTTFSTFPRSSPGEVPKKVPPVRPRPPVKKASDTPKTLSLSSSSVPNSDKTNSTSPLEPISKK